MYFGASENEVKDINTDECGEKDVHEAYLLWAGLRPPLGGGRHPSPSRLACRLPHDLHATNGGVGTYGSLERPWCASNGGLDGHQQMIHPV